MRSISILFILLGLFCMACCMPTQQDISVEEKEEAFNQFVKLNLPSDAEEVEDLENGWIRFSLVIDGEVKYFLFHRYEEGRYKRGYGFESLTEISLNPSPSDEDILEMFEEEEATRTLFDKD